ncbi:Immunoglobulin-like domain, partial [Trinorchestia longiramus]
GRSEKRVRHPAAQEDKYPLRFADYFLEDNAQGKGTMPAEEISVLPASATSVRTPSVFSPSNARSDFRCRRNAIRGKRSALRCKRRSFLGGGPPSFHPSSPKNITAQLNAIALLPCRIKNLGNKSVSWFRKRDSHILTVDRTTFIADGRFSAWHEG